MKKILYILIAIFTFTGCTLVPCGWKSDLEPVKKISKGKLIGKYLPDDKTKNRYSAFSDLSEVTLYSDGKIKMKKFPEGTFGMDIYDTQKKLNGEGTWTVYSEQKTPEIIVQLEYGFQHDNNKKKISMGWEIHKKDDQIVLFFIVGDPDGCSSVRLIKQTESLD